MRQAFSILLIFCYPLIVIAQPANYKKATESETTELINRLSGEISSIQCDFQQVKKSSLLADSTISKGIIYYESPNLLRVEYTAPKSHVIISNHDKIQMIDSRGKRSNSNKMFLELSRLITGIINGNEFSKSNNFSTELYVNETNIWIKMLPLNKRLKSIFKTIYITIDKKSNLANTIRLEEINGDNTTITLSGKKKNIKLPEGVFTIR